MDSRTYFLRDSMGNHMTVLGERNRKVAVVTGDLARTCRIQKFFGNFPERAFNVGIAEQNMVSFAAGLAHEGFVPYVFSMAPFISMRACEQCRTDVAYGNLKVRLVGTYAGCSGGISGATHWAMEDCAIMGSMAGMTVLEPSDSVQAEKMLDESLGFEGPLYIRNTVVPVSAIYREDYSYRIGKASVPVDGSDGVFICSGVMVKHAIRAAEIIRERSGREIRVVDMHTIKPVDREAVAGAAETGHIVVAQDHGTVGGLGYYVAAAIAESGLKTKFRILGIGDGFFPMAHAGYIYRRFGLDAEGLAEVMQKMLGVRK